MKLGIKVAPRNTWKQDIEATHPQMVEVWYNASRPDDYNDLFAYLATQPIDVGLHFWGVLPNNILTNIAYPDADINKASLALMNATVDVAAAHRFRYVNVHTDQRALVQVNFDTMDIRAVSKPADLTGATDNFLAHIAPLKRRANASDVVLTVETVPLRDSPSWKPTRPRTPVIDIHQLPIDVHHELARQGFAIANDFGHTACDLLTDDARAIWQFLLNATKQLAPQTRLIHIGFIVPPYNGMDFHDSLDNPLFDTAAAIPNKKQMIELIRLFQGRDDVYILVEPKGDHVRNYVLAKELLETAEKTATEQTPLTGK